MSPRPRRCPTVAARLVLLAALSTPACGGSPFGPERTELQRNRARWEARGPASYSYVYQARCFCGPSAVEPARVVVREGRVVSVVSVEAGEPVEPATLGEGDLTVDGLFDAVAAALEREPAHLDVTYDEELGFPRDVFFDFRERVADEEFGFGVTDLEPDG